MLKIGFVFITILVSLNAYSQPSAQPECGKLGAAQSWMPCGPDRVLSEAEMREVLFNQGEISRIDLTGGLSGRKFSVALKPEGKLDFGWTGGANLGRDWKVEGNKLCLRTYIREWRGQFICGPAELLGGKLLLWDESDGSKNSVDSVTFTKP